MARTLSILVVEDDGEIRQVLGELLAALFPEYRILLTESGEAALELVRRTRPSVVLLDLHLRGIDGFEFARRVRDLGTSAVPIVALTGDTSPATVRRAKAEGFAGYLVKPAGADNLERAIASVLRPAS